ncbi:MAG: hypothetical protein BAJALOKI1v1_2490001 [Promethearchaeota archaeon]|nr:MAG: hypothetical protein BAJALOKI1v1_2490001 [Candidatus Lokiarchaeota archaeon]
MVINSKSSDSNQEQEVIFYLDLSTDFLKRKYLLNGIETFIEENNKFNKKSTYGLVLFRNSKELYTIYNQDATLILDAIKDIWEERDLERSYFENGLYEILAYVFKLSRTWRKIYRIIVLTDAPSSSSEDYHSALYELILKAKNFSIYLDIIRVGDKKFYEDDVKLKIISSETFGGTLYCRESKQLKKYLSSLVGSREQYSYKSSFKNEVSPRDYPFFERLATDLISLSSSDVISCFFCHTDLCPICEKPQDELHKCFNCNTAFHDCCIVEYSKTNNIGIPHIFRCPKCESLLKIDKHLLASFGIDENLSPLPNPATTHIDTISNTENNIESEQYDPQEQFSEPISEPNTSERTIVKVGGFFGPKITINKSNTPFEIVDSAKGRETAETLGEKETPSLSITSLHPPKSKLIIKFCHICGTSVKNNSICPNCGAPL